MVGGYSEFCTRLSFYPSCIFLWRQLKRMHLRGERGSLCLSLITKGCCVAPVARSLEGGGMAFYYFILEEPPPPPPPHPPMFETSFCYGIKRQTAGMRCQLVLDWETVFLLTPVRWLTPTRFNRFLPIVVLYPCELCFHQRSLKIQTT